MTWKRGGLIVAGFEFGYAFRIVMARFSKSTSYGSLDAAFFVVLGLVVLYFVLYFVDEER